MQPIGLATDKNKNTLLLKKKNNCQQSRQSLDFTPKIYRAFRNDWFLPSKSNALRTPRKNLPFNSLSVLAFFLSPTVDRTGCTFHIFPFFFFLASGRMSISGTWMALRFKDLWKKAKAQPGERRLTSRSVEYNHCKRVSYRKRDCITSRRLVCLYLGSMDFFRIRMWTTFARELWRRHYQA